MVFFCVTLWNSSSFIINHIVFKERVKCYLKKSSYRNKTYNWFNIKRLCTPYPVSNKNKAKFRNIHFQSLDPTTLFIDFRWSLNIIVILSSNKKYYKYYNPNFVHLQSRLKWCNILYCTHIYSIAYLSINTWYKSHINCAWENFWNTININVDGIMLGMEFST